MSTIKISQLPPMSVEASNTSNTILLAVDLVNSITGTITATSLAQGLYSNNPLAVGNNIIQLPNTVAQFSGNGASYLQTNLLNTAETGTADIVVTANSGSDSTYFIDMGYANKNYQPGQEFNNIGTAVNALDGYIYAQGANSSVPGGNLIVGSTTSGREVRFVAGGGSSSNVIAKMTANGFYMMNGMPIYFADGTVLASANTVNLNSAIANTVYQNGVNATQNNSISAAFTQANSANILAQAAFIQANAALSLANTVNLNFAIANTVYTQGVDATQNNSISAVFNQSNSTNLLAQSAFNTANAALPLTGGTVSGTLSTGPLIVTSNITTPLIHTANSTSFTPNKNLSIIAGSDTLYNGGILTIQAGDAQLSGGVPGNIILIPGSGGSNNANGIVNVQGAMTVTGNIVAASIQTTTGAITTGNLIINGTANVSGTLNVVGIISGNAQVVLANTNFSNTQAALTISASPTVALPSQDGYMLHLSGKQNVSSRIVSDSYGANTYVVYAGRSARGNVSNPTAVQTGDVLSRFSGNGYGATKFQPFGTARIDFVAAENYTDSTTGSQIQFWNCPVGTNTLTNIATFNGTSVTFTGYVQPQKGFVYTPTVYPSAQTAITIDFANNSLVRAQTATGLTVTLSNLLAGKEVVAWITNTAGTNQTFTHGVSATNSTTNATNYNIPGTSTILARYMSIDGTLANTFVAVTHA